MSPVVVTCDWPALNEMWAICPICRKLCIREYCADCNIISLKEKNIEELLTDETDESS